MKHKKKRMAKAYQSDLEQLERDAQQERAGCAEHDLLRRKARTIWRIGMLVMLLLVAMPLLATPTMGAIILLPFAVVLALVVTAIAGIPGKKALAAALTPANGRKKRMICTLLLLIPYLVASICFLNLTVRTIRDYNGDNPTLWEELFYENEDLLNEVNQGLMNPVGQEAWYIAEIYAAPKNNEIEIVVVERTSGAVMEQGPLRNSQILTRDQMDRISVLLKKLRVPYTDIHFSYNNYGMSKPRGVYARFSVDAENVFSHFTNYEKDYEAGTWFLSGVTSEQNFDNAPNLYHSYLPEQKTGAQTNSALTGETEQARLLEEAARVEAERLAAEAEQARLEAEKKAQAEEASREEPSPPLERTAEEQEMIDYLENLYQDYLDDAVSNGHYYNGRYIYLRGRTGNILGPEDFPYLDEANLFIDIEHGADANFWQFPSPAVYAASPFPRVPVYDARGDQLQFNVDSLLDEHILEQWRTGAVDDYRGVGYEQIREMLYYNAYRVMEYGPGSGDRVVRLTDDSFLLTHWSRQRSGNILDGAWVFKKQGGEYKIHTYIWFVQAY